MRHAHSLYLLKIGIQVATEATTHASHHQTRTPKWIVRLDEGAYHPQQVPSTHTDTRTHTHVRDEQQFYRCVSISREPWNMCGLILLLTWDFCWLRNATWNPDLVLGLKLVTWLEIATWNPDLDFGLKLETYKAYNLKSWPGSRFQTWNMKILTWILVWNLKIGNCNSKSSTMVEATTWLLIFFGTDFAWVSGLVFVLSTKTVYFLQF